MNFVSLPSLEHIALVKVATSFWNEADIRASIRRFSLLLSLKDSEGRRLYKRENIREAIEAKVTEKVQLLSEPEPLKEKVLGTIKPIGDEIFKWLEYNYTFAGNVDELRWTPWGRLDRKKMAEALVRDETIDIAERYKLACVYCLKDDVEALWGKMPENVKGSFYSAENPSEVEQRDGLVLLWTYDIQGELSKLDSVFRNSNWPEFTPYRIAFEFSATTTPHNQTAAEYFFEKLNPDERAESTGRLLGTFLNSKLDVFLRLVSRMDRDQQLGMLAKHASTILRCSLNWPWQSLFVELKNHVMDFLEDREFCQILQRILFKMENALLERVVLNVTQGYRDFNYEKLFEKFWSQSPVTRKKYVVHQCAVDYTLLLKLCCFESFGRKYLSLILKEANQEEKENIFHSYGMFICDFIFAIKNWDLLEFFVSECVSSREKRLKFKDECKESFKDKGEDKERFFQVLDELIEKCDQI